MEKYKKLSDYPVNLSPSAGDLIPTIIDNGNDTYRNELIPYSALKGLPGVDGEGVPAGGSTGQVLKKSSAADYATIWGVLSKTDVGLNNVDNTADLDKPVSTAMTTAINNAINTAILQSKKDQYPVGTIYFNASNNTNPGSLLGFGTWVAWGSGRVPVGVDAAQTEFDTAEETGGSKTNTLSVANLPPHAHRVYSEWGTNANLNQAAGSGNYLQVAGPNAGTHALVNGSSETIGSGTAVNNLQPYITVYMWKRTA